MKKIQTANRYEIRVRSKLGASATAWFSDMAVTYTENGDTILTGTVADQAALHGMLMRIRDLGLFLLLVRHIDDSQEGKQDE